MFSKLVVSPPVVAITHNKFELLNHLKPPSRHSPKDVTVWLLMLVDKGCSGSCHARIGRGTTLPPPPSRI